MERLLNYVFTFIIIYLFVLWANAEEHTQMLIGLGGAAVLCFVAYVLNWLTLDGAQAAFVTGFAAFGLGGLPAALIIVIFFVTGSLLTPSGKSKSGHQSQYGDEVVGRRQRRNGIQVWANSFWFILLLCIWFIFEETSLLVASITAISTAMADTWATEIGYRSKWGKTYIIKSFRKVQAGTDGGLSLIGTFGGLVGSTLIATLSLILYPQISPTAGLLIAIMGFAGCLIDSLLGAYFQYEGQEINWYWFGLSSFSLDNDGVNFAASGISSVSTLFIIYILMLA